MKKFSLLMLSVLSLVALSACSISTSSSKSDSSSTEATSVASSSFTTESSSSSTYHVGDTITFDGVAEYVITGVEWTDERNQFDDTHPERVLKVTYNVTNLSDDDMYVGSDLDLYVASSKMDGYPNTNTMELFLLVVR